MNNPHTKHSIALGLGVGLSAKYMGSEEWLKYGLGSAFLSYVYMTKYGHSLPYKQQEQSDLPNLENDPPESSSSATPPASGANGDYPDDDMMSPDMEQFLGAGGL